MYILNSSKHCELHDGISKTLYVITMVSLISKTLYVITMVSLISQTLYVIMMVSKLFHHYMLYNFI